MPKRKDIKKVLVIGSGPIVIGQAAEFDYAGTQGCLALQEEGCEVILVNNNPATIMTDEQFADTVYFEPLTVQSITEIIKKENPDGILGTLGGQTGLNLTVDLYKKGILDKYNIQVLGTTPESIIQGEDREAFRSLMHELKEPVPESEIIHTVEEAVSFAGSQGYPIIIRPAYTLGGGGGGIVHNEEELLRVVKKGLESSPITQCLIEKSIAGLKEIEFEMIRDENDTCIAICSMENFDPVGVHTGDSIVFAPQQTLSDRQFNALYQSAVKIIRALKIVGGCNIQFAQDPASEQYYLIEVNPRLSRSSALASKATGYPIARIAAKLGLGYHLHEIINPVTGTTYASSEPVVDYTVVKMPRWAFDKFPDAQRQLGTTMKATGEIMAIDRLLPSALQKAVRSLELKTNGLELKGIADRSHEELWSSVIHADDVRFFSIIELLRRGEPVETIHDQTKIHPYFLHVLSDLVKLENKAKNETMETINPGFLKLLKENGFSDTWLASIWNVSLKQLKEKRKEYEIMPVFQMVDSCAGEFTAAAPYFYSTWKGEGDHILSDTSKKKIAIIGSGPVRIGQGIEFDYCTVQAALSLKKSGYETILINNNPGTVSTDFQIADRLYFEPLHIEDVVNILEFEKPDGVIVQLGGQTAINLAQGLEENGIPLLSINQDQIDIVEDRERFYTLLKELDIPHIPGGTAYDEQEVITKTAQIGFPVLLRPSYVIGGQGMIIVHNQEELDTHLPNIEYPVLIDAYYKGMELEVDVLADGKEILIPAYFEHIEKAGVHSGDSMTITPPIHVSEGVKKTVFDYAERVAEKLKFKGIFNIQFVVYRDAVYMLEVNPRASRTVPIVSKITGLNMIQECVNILTGSSLTNVQAPISPSFYTVKNPVFSTGKLDGVDPKLTPEMKSTGELIGIGHTLDEALAKSMIWNEQLTAKMTYDLPEIYVDALERDEKIIKKLLLKAGIKMITERNGIPFNEWVKNGKGSVLVSLKDTADSVQKRQTASVAQLQVMTELETFESYIRAIKGEIKKPKSIQDWLNSIRKDVVTP
ncbi:carbamoyl phosphate synthase large subunit [Siminovitchia sediminis]|uniref:carbamoyl-phosphate synthase (ammonia) n=1 Tax=Siminovitchia sediminis TaxID=1274353 RepID=A0ABW4KGW3_9BACI